MSLPSLLPRRRPARRPSRSLILEALERRELLASYTTPEDTPLVVTDPSLAALIVVRPPEHGKVVPTSVGGFVYSPALNYNGPDRFVYALASGTTAANTPPGALQEVSITVLPVNDPPEARGDEYVAYRNSPLTVAAPGVLKNDKDVDNQELKAQLVAEPKSGKLTLQPNGGFHYAPVDNFVGDDFFTYRASDGAATSAETKVVIHVKPLPDARDDSYGVTQNTVLTVPPRGVLANDLGVNGRDLVASLEPGEGNAPKFGKVELNANGSFTYKPAENFVGQDSFVYRATDATPALDPAPGGVAASPLPAAYDLARVTIVVRPSPVVRANPDFYSTLVDEPLRIAAPGVLKNDYFVYAATTNLENDRPIEDRKLVAKLADNVANGELTLEADGSFKYTPKSGFSGADKFTYFALAANATPPTPTPGTAAATGDGTILPPPLHLATVTIYVKQPEPPPGPVAQDDFYVAAANTPLSIRAPGVLANDYIRGPVPLPATTLAGTSTDPASPNIPPAVFRPLAAVLVDKPTHGQLTLKENGSFEYIPEPGFAGSDKFTYQARLLSVTAAGSNGSAASDAVPPVLSNLATVTIRVVPAIANYDYYSTPQGAVLDVANPGVLGNDLGGTNANPLTAELLSGPLNGTLKLSATGGFVYQPADGFTGADQFVYRAKGSAKPPSDTAPGTAASNTAGSDGIAPPIPSDQRDVAIVKIYVRPALPAVIANPDKYATRKNVELKVTAPGVLANDYGLANRQIVASLREEPVHGKAIVNDDGSFTYTPVADFVGEDKFTYLATATAGDSPAGSTGENSRSGIGTVVIHVLAADPLPGFLPGGDHRSTDESGPQKIEDWATLVAIGGERQPKFVVSTDNARLFASPPEIDATGQLSYTPAPNVSGTAKVTVALEGAADASAAATFTIDITKPHPLLNVLNRHDVDGDTIVAPGDALRVINHLNGLRPAGEGEAASPSYYDVSGDNVVSPVDALMVINYLNTNRPAAGEGEGPVDEALAAAQMDSSSASAAEDAANLADTIALLAADAATDAQRRRRPR